MTMPMKYLFRGLNKIMKMKKIRAVKKIIILTLALVLLFTPVAFGHGHGTESSSGESGVISIIVLLLIITGIFILSYKIKQLKVLPQRSLAIVIFLLTWEVAVRADLTYPASIPPASSVFNDLVDIALSGILWKHTVISLQRVFSGYALAIIIAVPLGFAVGWFKTWERFLDPLLQTFRQVPVITLFPVFILFFGIGELPKVLLIMLAAMWWILLSTINGVQNVDPFLVKNARSIGASHWDMFRKVVLPSALPSIFVGLRYASTEVILILIAVEMLGAQRGLGILLGRKMFAVILFMTILGVIANYILVALERRLCAWKEEIEVG